MNAHPKHVFFAKSAGDRAAFARSVFAETLPALKRLAPGDLKIGLTDAPNPRLTVIPLRRANLLMVSVWGDVDPGAFLRALEAPGAEVFGYRVEESSPARSERAWPLGERSPGVVLLTLLARNPRLDDEAFMHEWHGVHTPKAMRIHPLWGYVRNVVKERLSEDAPAFDGIVEEHYRVRADVMNPVRMFGGLRFFSNMLEVARHVKKFLDLRRTENYLLSEWRIAEER